MSNTNSTPSVPPTDADCRVVDQICAVINNADSSSDIGEAVMRIVRDTGRPYINDMPCLEADVTHDRYGIPTARIHLDGEQIVTLAVTQRGLHLSVATDPDQQIRVDAETPFGGINHG
ncbi:hypothetical protein GCM10010123_02270 [Pilimelia anulata]|uniref:Uncharacterized protein n=1 Tax=Pilimelia anulata TaxID=53371 RepID=A0A8J3F7E3_9ACTN|nr:hypothetical protein GCM10010123_02270 [Pilimelia anulata]